MMSRKNQRNLERIGIPEVERAYLAGASAQYESEVVYHNMKDEFTKLGIVFTDTDSALKEYPEIFKKYFAKLCRQLIINWQLLTQLFGQVALSSTSRHQS
jgi:Fe-S cluster assembly scaffold protein SufB